MMSDHVLFSASSNQNSDFSGHTFQYFMVGVFQNNGGAIAAAIF